MADAIEKEAEAFKITLEDGTGVILLEVDAGGGDPAREPIIFNPF